jgi:hypothetical protein
MSAAVCRAGRAPDVVAVAGSAVPDVSAVGRVSAAACGVRR